MWPSCSLNLGNVTNWMNVMTIIKLRKTFCKLQSIFWHKFYSRHTSGILSPFWNNNNNHKSVCSIPYNVTICPTSFSTWTYWLHKFTHWLHSSYNHIYTYHHYRILSALLDVHELFWTREKTDIYMDSTHLFKGPGKVQNLFFSSQLMISSLFFL